MQARTHKHYFLPKELHPLYPGPLLKFSYHPSPFPHNLLLEQLFYVHLSQGVARVSLVEIWNGDLLHVSLGDSQGVNYVAVTGQSYL